ncbi:MAG: metal-sulfur cluster assembly factor [Candidatus Competibacteraceae bacterium]|nr:metal-sulfur cluster assembly factor [Candidatus Competibacteraceae bacterium]
MQIVSNNPSLSRRASEALKKVIDPEIGLNIVDLGLIYQIDFFEEEKKIVCTMTLTTQFCPMGESITDAAKFAIQDAFAGYEADIELTFEPAWNYDMISEEGRMFLNM